MQGYLSLHLPAEELRSKVSLCQEWARQSSVSEDLETHVLLLEAFLQTGDLQVSLSVGADQKVGCGGISHLCMEGNKE